MRLNRPDFRHLPGGRKAGVPDPLAIPATPAAPAPDAGFLYAMQRQTAREISDNIRRELAEKRYRERPTFRGYRRVRWPVIVDRPTGFFCFTGLSVRV